MVSRALASECHHLEHQRNHGEAQYFHPKGANVEISGIMRDYEGL